VPDIDWPRMANKGDPAERLLSGGMRAGDIIGHRWRLESFLESGGMGSVWRATDLRLDEAVALKLMNPMLVRTEHAQRRFLREARASAQLRGPNMVSIFDFDVDPTFGVPYMAMELLRGESLSARLKRGPLGYLQTTSVLRDLCAVLTRAHRISVVHRDIKPANIFMCPSDTGPVCKLLDFGIAKMAEDARQEGLTDSGSMLGTPNYMSPEQTVSSKFVDHRADLWATAVVIYECLVGQRAFQGSSAPVVLRKIGAEDPTPPSQLASVPPGIDAWFARATRRHADDRFNSAHELLEAFIKAGSATTRPRTSDARPGSDPQVPRAQAWASDANQIDIESIEDIVFETSVVREFVQSDQRYFVSGAKGCGKTLLLTYKRARLAERYQRGAEGSRAMIFVPEGRPYLDLMGDLRNVGRSNQELMATVSEAKRLWGFALRLSAISHHPSQNLDEMTLAALPPRLRQVAKGQKAEPTVVLKEVLQLSTSQIHQLLNHAEMPLEHAVRSMHSGMMFFIDKIDQALREVSRDAWVAMQAGLVEAAWDMMNTNAHIKVFATIREEAFSSYESDIKTNLFGATTRIRYSKADLRNMLERLTSFYEGLPLRDFVTIDVVTAPGAAQTEGAFDFLYRHTLGRPRDLVIIASEISRNRSQLDERSFKAVVYETSAGILVSNVFDEMRVFLEVLADRTSRARFLAALPYGVLTHDDLIEVWCQYHGVQRAYFEEHGHDSAEVYHPFRELYDCGLLGVIEADLEDETPRQAFKQPHQPMELDRFDLRRSPAYLLHPSLQALIRKSGFGSEHRAMREIVIGHEQPWGPHYSLVLMVQREMYRTHHPEPEVERAVMDLLSELGRHVAAGRALEDVRAKLGDSPTFARLCERLDALELDDVHLALLEAFGSELRPTVEDRRGRTQPKS